MKITLNKKSLIKHIIKEQVDIKFFVLWIMVAIFPFIVIPNKYGYFYFPRYIILAVLAVVSLPTLFREKIKIPNRILIPLGIFIILMIISGIKAQNTKTAWMGLFGIIGVRTGTQQFEMLVETARFTGISTYMFCIILFLLAFRTEKPNRDKLVNWMIGSAAVISFIAVLQFYGLNIVPHEVFRNGSRGYGTFGNPNFLGTYTAFILPVAIMYFIKYNKKIWLLFTILIFGGLLVNLTRGAWLATALSFIIIAVYCYNHKETHKNFLIIFVTFIIVTFILMPSNDWIIYKKILSIPNNIATGMEFQNDTGSGRLFIWKETVKLIPKYWAFGMGPDNLIYAGISRGGFVDKAHNIYLEILITMGIFALISYIVFLSEFLKKWEDYHGFVFFIMIFTYLVQAFFNIDVIMVIPLFWIILGISLANNEDIGTKHLRIKS